MRQMDFDWGVAADEQDFTDGPDVLVVTVGLSPLPVALAILTLDCPQVILAHTTATAPVARCIAQVLAPIRTARNLPAAFELVDCGDGDDLAATATCFTELAETIGDRDFRLDYSGGTKVMTVAAVVAHMDHHHERGLPDRGGQWRTWIDDTYGTLVPGSARAEHRAVETSTLSTELIAALHGMRLQGFYRCAPVPTAEWSTQIDDTIGLLDRADVVDRNDPEYPAWITCLQNHAAVLATALGLDDPHRLVTSMRTLDDARGSVRELLVALICAWALHGAHPAGGWELMVNVHAVPADRNEGTTAVSEADVVVRKGHHVLAIEVKSNADKALKLLGDRVVSMRWAFGTAVTSWVTGAQGHQRKDDTRPAVPWSRVEHTCQDITATMPSMGKVAAGRLDADTGSKDVDDLLAAWLQSLKRESTFQSRTVPVDVTGAAVTVVPVDGTPVAVQAAIRSAPTHVLGIGTAETNTRLADAFTKLGKNDAGTYLRVPAAGEAATVAALKGIRPAAVMVTPGPKGVTAGLLRVALDAGRREAAVHLGIDGTVQRLGTSGTEAEITDFAVDWPAQFGDRYIPLAADPADPAARAILGRIRRALEAAGDRLEVFVPADPATLDIGVAAPLIVAGRRGCASVHIHIPKTFPEPKSKEEISSNKNQLKDAWRDFKTAVKSRSTQVAAVVGDAHKPLLVLGTDISDARVTEFARQQVRERWLPFARFDTGTGTVRFGRTDDQDGEALKRVASHLTGR